jgi:hypothetical protein
MLTNKLLNTNNVFQDAMSWSERESEIPLGHKIRVTFSGLKPKTGYAYKQEGAWLGIRYTWKSMRWWSLLNYNNPLIKLELQELDGEGKANWRTIWERESE